MKKASRRQIATIFIALVGFVLFVSILINTWFLESFYVRNKQRTLIGVYNALDAAATAGELTSERFIDRLNELVEVGNVSLVVVNDDNKSFLTATTNEARTREMVTQLMGYLVNQNQDKGKLLKSTQNYEIRSAEDVVGGGEYIEMWGYLSTGNAFILRSPLESIRESVTISNQFLIYITLVIGCIGCVFAWVFARQISLKNANYELQKDIEKKEKLESMRTEFIGNVSHELKTPIALIQGYAEGLKEGISDDPESRAFYCEVIMDEANKMNQLVKNLLTLNQLEFGEEEVAFERFDIVELIQGVLQSNEILIQQKEAEVRLHAEQPVYVWADEFKVEQVVRNYLSNALNHLDNERIIDIRLTVREDAQKVRVSVFNTGVRIPQEDKEQIWNKFYKVDKARTREYGGHGIGLSIVRAIMESFHQEYGVDNYENGVAFWFELDLK